MKKRLTTADILQNNSRVNAVRDVNDALAQDEFNENIKSMLPLLILAALVIILGAAGMEIYKYFHHRDTQAQTALLASALASSDNAQLAELDGAHKAIALFKLAAAKQDKAAAYSEIAADKSVPDTFRDLATILSVQTRFDAGATDAKALLTEVTPLAVKKESPWQAQALLTSALIKASLPNGKEAALQELAQIEQLESASPFLVKTAKDLTELYRQSK